MAWSVEILDKRYRAYYRPSDWCKLKHGFDFVLIKAAALHPRLCAATLPN